MSMRKAVQMKLYRLLLDKGKRLKQEIRKYGIKLPCIPHRKIMACLWKYQCPAIRVLGKQLQ